MTQDPWVGAQLRLVLFEQRSRRVRIDSDLIAQVQVDRLGIEQQAGSGRDRRRHDDAAAPKPLTDRVDRRLAAGAERVEACEVDGFLIGRIQDVDRETAEHAG